MWHKGKMTKLGGACGFVTLWIEGDTFDFRERIKRRHRVSLGRFSKGPMLLCSKNLKQLEENQLRKRGRLG
jgi:hypothetical protein